MTYPAPFHRVVLIGDLYGDIFNTTLSVIPASSGPLPAVTEELAQDVAENVAAWFVKTSTTGVGGGCGFISAARLTSVKVNRIGTNGRYMDPEAIEYVLPTPAVGPGTQKIAPQLTMAATFRGAAPRELAGNGRMFLPPTGTIALIGSDGRIPAADSGYYAQGVLSLIYTVIDAYAANSISPVVGIASNTRGGAFQPVSEVRVGRTVDTIRSRRNKIPEDYVAKPV